MIEKFIRQLKIFEIKTYLNQITFFFLMMFELLFIIISKILHLFLLLYKIKIK